MAGTHATTPRRTQQSNGRDNMASTLLLIVGMVLVLDATQISAQKELPEYINICKKNDPAVIDCVKATVNDLKPYLAKGIPELNVPALEPLALNEIIVSGGSSPLRVSAKEILAYGASNFDIVDLTLDFNDYDIKLKLDLPLLYIVGRYDVDGRILLIPVKGNGPMTLNITDCKATVDISGKVITEDGQDFLTFKSLDVKFEVGSGSVKLDNLFGGDKTLGEAINIAINSNFGHFLRDLKPSIEKELSRSFFEISNNIVKGATLSQLFPED